MAHIVYCPVNGWDCPYFKNNFCTIENPEENCDDFALIADFFSDLDDEEEDEPDYEDELRAMDPMWEDSNFDPYDMWDCEPSRDDWDEEE